MWGERKYNLKVKGVKLFDLGITFLAFVLAYEIKSLWLGGASGWAGNVNYLLIMLIAAISCTISYDFFNLYEFERRPTLHEQVRRIVKGVVAGSAMAVFFFYVFKLTDISRLMIALFMVLDVALLVVSRVALQALVRKRRQRSLGHRNVLIIGSKERARDLIRFVQPNAEQGYHLLGCLDPDPSRVNLEVEAGVQVLGTLESFESILLQRAVDEVVIAMPLKEIEGPLDYIGFAERVGINVRVLPDWQLQKLMFQPEVASVFVEKFVGMPTLALSSVPRREFELFIKSACDRVSAGLGLVVLSPLFLTLAAVIRLTSKGPIFFRQERSGLNGRIFTLYKFRTMVANAEELKAKLAEENEMDGPVFKIRKDPRITGIGQFLRKTSLDELPQLINIVKGEMSLVGPRPPLPVEVAEYEPWQRRRLSMKPGLTCIWQVSGRNNISFERWMKMDLEYIDQWSLALDAKLLAKTLPAVVFGSGH